MSRVDPSVLEPYKGQLRQHFVNRKRAALRRGSYTLMAKDLRCSAWDAAAELGLSLGLDPETYIRLLFEHWGGSLGPFATAVGGKVARRVLESALGTQPVMRGMCDARARADRDAGYTAALEDTPQDVGYMPETEPGGANFRLPDIGEALRMDVADALDLLKRLCGTDEATDQGLRELRDPGRPFAPLARLLLGYSDPGVAALPSSRAAVDRLRIMPDAQSAAESLGFDWRAAAAAVERL